MADQGLGAAGALPEDLGGDPQRRDWSSADLQLDGRARPLIERLLRQDDGTALLALIDILAGRLEQLEPSVLDEVGVGVPLPLASEWFSSLLVDCSKDAEVPAHPLAAAMDWMTGRAEALVNTLSAQPLSWEEGYRKSLPAEWLGRLALEQSDPESFYMTIVAFHRLPRQSRQVLRDVDVLGRGRLECARLRGLTEEQVIHVLGEVRESLHRILDHHDHHGEGGDV